MEILGVQLRVLTPTPLPGTPSPRATPEALIVPRNVGFRLGTFLGTADGTSLSTDPCFAGAVVRGELSGPGLASSKTLQTTPGADLAVPPLSLAGNYVIDNLRLVTVAASGAETPLLSGSPPLIQIRAIERLLVSNVSTRPLSIEKIQAAGIVLGDRNFQVYEFTFQVQTSSQLLTIPLDVAFGKDAAKELGERAAEPLPHGLPGLVVPNLEYMPFLLRPDDE